MKKIISLLLSGFLLQTAVFAQENPPSKIISRDTLSKIVNQGVIVLAVRENSVPFSYFDSKGNTIGYSVELCERVAKKLRRDMNMTTLKIVYLPVQAAERMDVVKKGIADMECGVTTNNKERQENVSFSMAIFAVETKFATEKSLVLKDVSELNGKQISVSAKSIGEGYVTSQKKEKGFNYQINQYPDTKESMLAVLDNTSQAHPNDDILLYSLIAFNPAMKEKLHVTGNAFSPNTYGIVLPKGDRKFKEAVDVILKSMMASGEINKIYEKWFLSPIPPNNVNINFSMNETTKKIFASPTDAAFIDK